MEYSEKEFLMQLGDSLDEALLVMEKNYSLGNTEKFNSAKNAFLDINKQIKERIE